MEQGMEHAVPARKGWGEDMSKKISKSAQHRAARHSGALLHVSEPTLRATVKRGGLFSEEEDGA
jgi:hypothetical protein